MTITVFSSTIIVAGGDHGFSSLNSDESSKLEIEQITTGRRIQVSLRNMGDTNLTNIEWRIQLDGGFVILGKNAEGLIPILYPGKNQIIQHVLVFGFGVTEIQITAISDEGAVAEKTYQAHIRGFSIRLIPGDSDALVLHLERIARGLKAPTVLTHAGDGSGRLFVAEQTGVIRIIQNNEILPDPFLDVSEKMVKLNPIYDERGLLGLVFHPQYAANGRFYVYYSALKSETGIDHESILAQYTVSDDPNQADASSEVIILRVDQPEANHNGGQIAFGPDGYLYIGLGDGGGAGDQHGAIGNGQNINTLLGAVLRIDVDTEAPYAIPLDNPFVGQDGLDEIFAYGFRNPYRFSFDQLTGELFVADVGQDEWEEIDIVERGGNYGWRILEGTHGYDPALADELGLNMSDLKAPIHEYSHAVGRSIIGGYRYRGSYYPDLFSLYVFGDWSTGFIIPSGRVYYLVNHESDGWIRKEFQLSTNKPLNRFILGFGEDEQGELYMVTTRLFGSLGRSGEVWQLQIE